MMNLFRSPEDRDDELLSAYLDNALAPGDHLKLEARLAVDLKLRRTLNELRAVKTGLTDLPKVKPPRNFTLTPALAGQPARRPASPLIPALNWATTVAAILFVAVLSADLMGNRFLAAPPSESQVLTTQVEAPAAEAAPQVALAPDDTQSEALKSATATPDSTLRVLVEPSAEVAAPPVGAGTLGEDPYSYAGAEPLTDVPGTPTPSLSDSAVASSETPTPEGTAVAQAQTADQATIARESETTVAEVAPVENADMANTQSTEPGTNTLRLAQLVLGLALVGLVTASFILRRK